MRARMALLDAGVCCELREVLLSAKPQAMLDASPKGTVPVLCLPDGRVLDESLDIMCRVAQEHRESLWWPGDLQMRKAMLALIGHNDHLFKYHLDRYKYPQRFGIEDTREYWLQGGGFLAGLEARLQRSPFLFGPEASLADVAIFPFVRQFAAVDRAAFDALPYPHLHRWLRDWLDSSLFASCMQRHVPWQPGDAPVYLC